MPAEGEFHCLDMRNKKWTKLAADKYFGRGSSPQQQQHPRPVALHSMAYAAPARIIAVGGVFGNERRGRGSDDDEEEEEEEHVQMSGQFDHELEISNRALSFNTISKCWAEERNVVPSFSDSLSSVEGTLMLSLPPSEVQVSHTRDIPEREEGRGGGGGGGEGGEGEGVGKTGERKEETEDGGLVSKDGEDGEEVRARVGLMGHDAVTVDLEKNKSVSIFCFGGYADIRGCQHPSVMLRYDVAK